jgi:hypothetical protein
MTRMILSLDDRDKAWLERKAAEQGVSMASVVRLAVRTLQTTEESSLKDLLDETRGIWKSGDGLKYQRRLRAEWK